MYVNVPWGQVHLRTSSAKHKNTLVMLHQSPLSSVTFEGALDVIANHGITPLALDTPGYGHSDAPPQPWFMEDYASAVWIVLDALHISNPVFLGQHTGALIAWECAVQRPAQTAGLVFMGLPLYSDEERAHKLATYANSYLPLDDRSHLEFIWQRISNLYPHLTVEEKDRQLADYLLVGADYGQAYRAAFHYKLDPSALKDMPKALMHGDRDVVHRMTDLVSQTFPEATVDVLDGSDFVATEKPEIFAQTLSARVSGWFAARP